MNIELNIAQYVVAVNEQRFDDLHPWVHPDVEVNDTSRGLESHIDGLKRVFQAHPGYHWHIERTVCQPPMTCVQYRDTTSVQGREIDTVELAMYEFNRRLIRRVWVAADDLRLRQVKNAGRDLTHTDEASHHEASGP